jgi:serine/threonine-protein kinase
MNIARLRPGTSPRLGPQVSSGLSGDLHDQVRARLRLLALLILIAFAIDPAFFFGGWAIAALRGGPVASDITRDAPFYLADVCVVIASGSLWLFARNRRASANRLHSLGLAYEVAVCFVLALRTFWEYYRDTGILPNLTWVPAVVILFPLILPARPRVMLATAIIAAAMSPLALLLLDLWGMVVADGSHYINTAVSSAIAVGFAYMGSRVVYGLRREVAEARELGSYHLIEQLGRGGMGEVWLARHRMLARPAAIKLIRPSGNAGHGVTEAARRRFEREAQAIARLRSPHTVELFDFGVSEDGAFYYVMELLTGMDADRLVRRFGPVPAGRAIHLLRQVCHSLSEAESCGLVHRDIKPANIFICHYGEEDDFVKVLDFGIVKAADGTKDTETGLTLEDAVQGTPAFMAPEQALGAPDLDGRADIYATGCVAYWLLTGQVVFTAETVIGVLLHHTRTPPAAPSTRTELPIPPALDRLVLQCLAKDPADRPQSARELSRRLAAIEDAGTWTEDHAQAWWMTHHPARKATAEES